MGNQIVAGRAAYETLRVRDEYVAAFREIRVQSKNANVLTAYQFIRNDGPHLNVAAPSSVLQSDPIDLTLTEALGKPGNYSTSGQVACIGKATEHWKVAMGEILEELYLQCSGDQAAMLKQSQDSWVTFSKKETAFMNELRKTVRGTMYRVFGADLYMQMARERVRTLRLYRDEWLGSGDE